MMTFREFLKKKAEEQSHGERRARREEWIASVHKLLQQVRSWLDRADPDHVLDVALLETDKVEQGLGPYRVPSLKITLGNASVRFDPIGREVVGFVGPRGDIGVRAEGRVDVTDGVRKYILYRTLEGGKEKWYALDEHFDARPFDRARLEAILQDLLS